MATNATNPNATDPMPAGHPAAAPGPCPVCGGRRPDRTGLPGRRAAWCSKACRQAAWRARTAADRASRSAAELSDRIAGTGYGDVLAAGNALGEAVITMCEQSDGDHEDALMTGHRWERHVADAVQGMAAAAGT
ncbi:hypothetical protein, partial [Actinomadura napierensis]|uniref:hypothetical protein n=1 Tax=Actinomadura napierensis TaxID=267854 RepID=UPI0031E304B3